MTTSADTDTVTTLAGLGPAPGYLHACSLSVFTTSKLEPGVWLIGWATKALIRLKSGERWIGALGWSLDLDRDWIWIVVGFGVSLVLDYRRRLFILPFT